MIGSPELSVVIPVYNEEESLRPLWSELQKVLDALGFPAEVVFVDDGSRDRSAELIRGFIRDDPRARLVRLKANSGETAANDAGFRSARGRIVVTMDADLQDPPELIPELVAAWRGGAEIVRAARRSRAETGMRRAGFDLFHSLFGRLTDFPIEPNTGTFGLIGRDAIEAFHQLPERHRFFPGLRAWIGFPSTEVLYDRQERAAGEPQQTFRRLIRYALDGVFSFSHLPLRLLTYVGLFIAFMGFAGGLFFILWRVLGFENSQQGFTTLVVLVLFLGGIQLIGIGVLGEYLGRIYDEVKQRPLYVVKRRTGGNR